MEIPMQIDQISIARATNLKTSPLKEASAEPLQ